jgi:hypothetical protein
MLLTFSMFVKSAPTAAATELANARDCQDFHELHTHAQTHRDRLLLAGLHDEDRRPGSRSDIVSRGISRV